jgi:hypothetical protein
VYLFLALLAGAGGQMAARPLMAAEAAQLTIPRDATDEQVFELLFVSRLAGWIL